MFWQNNVSKLIFNFKVYAYLRSFAVKFKLVWLEKTNKVKMINILALKCEKYLTITKKIQNHLKPHWDYFTISLVCCYQIFLSFFFLNKQLHKHFITFLINNSLIENYLQPCYMIHLWSNMQNLVWNIQLLMKKRVKHHQFLGWNLAL